MVLVLCLLGWGQGALGVDPPETQHLKLILLVKGQVYERATLYGSALEGWWEVIIFQRGGKVLNFGTLKALGVHSLDISDMQTRLNFLWAV
jgi:hypothetical protein